MNEVSADPPFPAAEQLTLDAIVRRCVGEQGVPGAVVGVWIGGRGAWVQAVGIGNLRTAAPIVADGHFRIASVSKTFVATVILQLVDEGKLVLEETLDRFVSGVPNGERITIRQLLGMTAGIFNYVGDPEFERAYTSDPLMPFPRRQVVEILRRHEPDFPPGEQVRYSDSNYFLAGFVIEAVTGRSAAKEIASRILEPLRLSGTGLPDSPYMPHPHPRGYAAEPGSAELRDLTESNPAVPWTAGAMISTLDDLRVWSKALATGTLLSPAMQRERLRWQPLSFESGREFGYGLGIMSWHGFLGHAGAIFGYSTWMLHSPQDDATLVVLANRGETETEFASKITNDILHQLFPEQFPREANPPASATPEA
jgi:D-alanyl-D-alanine carboxypeptidase